MSAACTEIDLAGKDVMKNLRFFALFTAALHDNIISVVIGSIDPLRAVIALQSVKIEQASWSVNDANRVAIETSATTYLLIPSQRIITVSIATMKIVQRCPA